MTTRKRLKRRARSRAAATGESYAKALRTIRRDQLEDSVPTVATNEAVVFASCSFCAKPNTEVRKLVAGPGVFICDACVDLSATIIAATLEETAEESARRREAFVDHSVQDMLALLPGLARSSAQLESDMKRWVGRLREQGTEWQRIAQAVAMSVDAARQRFEPLTAP